MSTHKTVILIAGPTAVGKTSLALELAKKFSTAIISADSRQCYRELNIGVAKPSTQQLAEIKHYFINSHSIHDLVNASCFEKYALDKADEIFLHHDVAVMVGGTGLYIKAFCEGLDDIPEVSLKIRAQIIEEYKLNGMEWLRKKVEEEDNLFWLRSDIQNPQRLMRSLEVKRSTGRSILSFRKEIKRNRPFKILKIGLDLPRNELYRRIDNRVDMMMECGLVEEARSLIVFQNLNALRTVGYAELFEFFNGKATLMDASENIKKHTRHYAKRQMTWFRKDADMRWFLSGDTDKITEFIAGSLG